MQNILIKTSNILQDSGINSVYWSHRLWENFTTITAETNGKVQDEHWGEGGNKDFAEFLYNEIINKNYIILDKK